jgi:hypothetical protein
MKYGMDFLRLRGPEQYSQGFIRNYSKVSLEFDLDEVARDLFVTKGRDLEASKEYPRLHKKFLLLIAFYHRLNPAFSESYFAHNLN